MTQCLSCKDLRGFTAYLLLLDFAVIGGEWAEQLLTFAEYKARGPVILKGAETTELVEKLEDSQMTLGSLASNRYSTPFRDEVSNTRNGLLLCLLKFLL